MNKSRSKKEHFSEPILQVSDTSAEIAYGLIHQHYDRMIQQESGVLADKDPENLHRMRVSRRRLCTALQVFSQVIALPKSAQAKKVYALTKALGDLRDLDVQIVAIRRRYMLKVDRSEQKQLKKLVSNLKAQRVQTLGKVTIELKHPLYKTLKETYDQWFSQPKYEPIANSPISLILPDLLNPLLTEFLIHPAWFMMDGQNTRKKNSILHDLRKTCKAVRYQAEFFTSFYDSKFQDWVKSLEDLQEYLGKLQDAEVFQDLLLNQFGEKLRFPELTEVIKQEQQIALAHWNTLRPGYLNADFRDRLRQLILNPL